MGLFRRHRPDSAPTPERQKRVSTEAELAIVEYTAKRTVEELTDEFLHVDNERKSEYQRTVLRTAEDPEVAARAVAVIQDLKIEISHRDLEWQISFVQALRIADEKSTLQVYERLQNEDKRMVSFEGGIQEQTGRRLVERMVYDQKSLNEISSVIQQLPINRDEVRRDLMPLLAIQESISPVDILSFTDGMEETDRDIARGTATKLMTSKWEDCTVADALVLLEGIENPELKAEAGISAAKHLALRSHVSPEMLLTFIQGLDGEDTQETALMRAVARLYDAGQTANVREIIERHPPETRVTVREAVTNAIHREFARDQQVARWDGGVERVPKYSQRDIRKNLTPRTELVELLDRQTARV